MKKLLWLTPILGALSCASAGADDKTLKAYPAPQAGYQRFVIALEPQSDESRLKVEVLAGKTLPVDCNRVGMSGELEERVAEGWGYPYYVVENVGPPVSTKMACPPEHGPKPTFVPIRGGDNMVRYNSKLPLVVYVPEGFEVRYRLWKAGDERRDAVRR